MRIASRWIVTIALLLSACGGSGGNSGAAPREAACEGACTSDPDTEPPPLAPLRCDGPDAATCPEGYRCVDDAADDCDPATGTECAGLCVLGEELPGCGMTREPCPPGSVCIDDPDDTCDGGPVVDCPGLCQPEAIGDCQTDGDCPALPAMCHVCADGSASCPISRCDAGKCIVDAPPCPEPARCGVAGLTCPPGFMCVDNPDDTCDDNLDGNCPRACEPALPEECTSDADCPALRAPCTICPDGSEACPTSSCEGGRCNVSFPACAPAVVCGENGGGCNPGEICVADPESSCDPAVGPLPCKGKCVAVDGPRPCGEPGGVLCPPGYECTTPDGTTCDPDAPATGCGGICVPSASRECSSDSECPQVPGPCLPCPDGTVSCSHAECRNAVCAVVHDACTGPDFCGGIAGFPCPLGLTCVDNPNDDCDPQRGGADCAGMCVREEKPASCGGGTTCPPGYECADDPDDDCDPNGDRADCPGICRPASPPACSSDADCVVIAAPCRICPDGTAACPRTSCVNGACQVDFGACTSEG